MTTVRLPFYSPTAVLVGTGVLVLIVVAVVIMVLRNRR